MAEKEFAPDPARHLLVGKVGKAHGIKGEIKFSPFSEDPGNVPHYGELLLCAPDSERCRLYEVSRSRPQGKQAILELTGVTSREQAEALIGCQVWIDKTLLPEPAADEFYLHELEGLTVVTDDGRDLGTVKGLMAAGGSDLLVVVGHGREFLIPARVEFLAGRDGDKLIVTLPEGFLEIND